MAVLLVAFVIAQALLPKTATIPPRILKYRSVTAGFWSTICIGSSQYIYGKKDSIARHFLLMADLGHSVLHPDLVSIRKRCHCCGIWHPACASDARTGCRVNFWGISKSEDRILHAAGNLRSLHDVRRGRAPHDLTG